MKRILVITPVLSQARANQDASAYDQGGSHARTFTVGLSPTGLAPATHYWASMSLSDADFETLKAKIDGYVGAELNEYNLDTDLGFPARRAQELGLKPISQGLG